ncbi:MAG: glycosyltransferase [Spirochaetes bacterium]|nr:glycosyltransferase [Spirochaetota bacterium]
MKNLIVLPVYNRSSIINNAILKLSKEINESFEILVIDDGSEDNTAEIIETDSQIKFIQHENTLGYGGCLINALDYAKMNEFQFMYLLDISYDGFIRAFKDMRDFKDEFDILNCSRYTSMKSDEFPNDDYINYNLSLQISAKINSVTEYNLEDTFSPFKLFRLDSLSEMTLEEFDEAFIIQLFIQSKHFKLNVKEIFCDSVRLDINKDDFNLEYDMDYYLNFIEGEILLYPCE